MARQAPVVTLADGRAVYALTAEQRRELHILMRRYYTWLASDRKADPWASGVGQGIRYDRPRVQHGPPPGGYGPGVASTDDDGQATLERVHGIITALPAHQQAMLRMRVRDGLTHERVAEAMGLSADVARDEWRRVTVRLYHAIHA